MGFNFSLLYVWKWLFSFGRYCPLCGGGKDERRFGNYFDTIDGGGDEFCTLAWHGENASKVTHGHC